MRAVSLSVLICLAFPFVGRVDASIDHRSIVKIFVTSSDPNSNRPWTPEAPSMSSATGFVIEGNRIITNAHVVAFNTFIAVRKGGDSKRYEAEAVFVSHQADLAILRVKDEGFFEGLSPLRIGETPSVQDALIVVGYPRGGDELSYTSGIVSRIEVNAYAYSYEYLLTLQVDAVINSGNSGGPALVDDRVVGIAMMSRTDADGVGYLIPPEIIMYFLRDIEDGTVDGFPNLAMTYIPLENPALRDGYGLDPAADLGILVTRVAQVPGGETLLRPGDIILGIDGIPVRGNGKLLVQDRLLDLSYLVSGRQVGEALPMLLLRDGKEIPITLTCAVQTDLVEYRYYERDFPYYLFGGMLFCPLYGDKLFASGSDWPDPEMYYLATLLPSAERRQVVYLHTVFQHELTRNMPGVDHIVRSVNGVPVGTFEDFVRMFDRATGIVEIEFDSAIRLRLDTGAMRAIEDEMMDMYSIPKRKVMPIARL